VIQELLEFTSDKMALVYEDKLTDGHDTSDLNSVKEHEAIAASFAYGKRDSRNTIQLVEIFEALGGKDFVVAAMIALIKTHN